MKNKLFALIIAAAALAGCSTGSRLTSSSDGHMFQDGIYTTRADYARQKAALAASQTVSSQLISETRTSDLYMADGNGSIKPVPYNAIIDSTSGQAPTILNFNISYDPYWSNYYDFRWGYHWGWGWYGDPFWYDCNWRWIRRWTGYAWGPHYLHWDPFFWDPWCYDPWYRPIYHYGPGPYYAGGGYWHEGSGRINRGNHLSASVGGRHGMGGAGINGRTVTVGRSTTANGRTSSKAGAARVSPTTTATRVSQATGRTATATVTRVSPSVGRQTGTATKRADSNVRSASPASTRSVGSYGDRSSSSGSYSGRSSSSGSYGVSRSSSGGSYSGRSSSSGSYSGRSSSSGSYSGMSSSSGSYSGGGRSSSGGHSGRR